VAHNDVFISYRRKDIEFVRKLDAALRETGREMWVDWEDIPPGSTDFTNDIAEGIESSDAFIAVLSPDYLDSPYCLSELEYAVKLNKRLVPVVVKKFEGREYPPSIAHINWVYFVEHAGQANEWDTAFSKVIEALEMDQEHARAHTRLLQRAKEWDDKKRNRSFLLKGKELQDAEQWLTQAPGKIPRPIPLHAEYIAASRDHQRRQQQRWLTAVSVVAVAMLGLAVISILLFFQAQRSAQEAESFALAASAREVQNTDQTLALILARASNAIPSPDIQSQKTLADIAYKPGPRRVFTHPDAHQASIWSLALSPDAKTLASGSADGSVKLWNTADATLIDTFTLDSGEVYVVAFSPDGRYLAMGTHNGPIFVRDMTDGSQFALEAHTDTVNGLAFNPVDPNMLVSASDDGTARLWDVAARDSLRFISRRLESMDAVAFSPNGLEVAIASSEFLRVWNVDTRRFIQMLDYHRNVISSIDYYSDGSCILTGATDTEIARWCFDRATSTYKLARTYSLHGDLVNSVAINNTNSVLYSASSDQRIVAANINSGQPEAVLTGHTAAIYALVLSPDGKRLYSADSSGAIYEWDTLFGAIENAFTPPSRGGVRGVAVTQDGAQLLTTTRQGEVVVFDAASGEELRRMAETRRTPRDVAVDPQKRYVLLSAWDDEAPLTLFDFETGAVIRNYTLAGEFAYADMAQFSADGRRIVTTFTDESTTFAAVIDTESGELVRVFEEPLDLSQAERIIAAAAFSVDEQAIFYGSSSADTPVIMADITTGETIKTFSGMSDTINTLAVSADGRYLAAGGFDRNAVVWDIASGQEVARFRSNDKIWSLDFSPDSALLVTASGDKVIEVYDLALLQAIRTYRGHINEVLDVSFTTDSNHFVSTGSDDLVFMWRIDNFEALNAWVVANRYNREPTCNERLVYHLQPYCE